MKRWFLAATALLVTITSQAMADPVNLIVEDFSGELNGKIATAHANLQASPWVADTIFGEDGQINDGNNTDRGAYIDLGENFEFAAESTYTLELAWEDLSNAILFAGFAIDAPNVGSQMQTQKVNFALRARRIAAETDKLATWQRVGGNNTAAEGSVVTEAAGTATLTITTNARNNATFTVDGCDPVAVDLTPGYRYLWIGYEDPSSGTSDARLLGLTFRGPAPLPPVILVEEDFSGELNGKAATAHANLRVSPWVADGIFGEDGQINDGSINAACK